MAAATIDQQGRLLQRRIEDMEMPEDIINDRTPEGYTKYEDFVDKFIKDKGLKAGDRFRVPHGKDADPRIYEYLGPGSGGRKDWRELRSRGES